MHWAQYGSQVLRVPLKPWGVPKNKNNKAGTFSYEK